jgi:hypothetical protein
MGRSQQIATTSPIASQISVLDLAPYPSFPTTPNLRQPQCCTGWNHDRGSCCCLLPFRLWSSGCFASSPVARTLGKQPSGCEFKSPKPPAFRWLSSQLFTPPPPTSSRTDRKHFFIQFRQEIFGVHTPSILHGGTHGCWLTLDINTW